MQTQSGLWIVIGDIHDATGNFDKIPELAEADGIIISGDLTNEGGPEQAAGVMSRIGRTGLPVFAQIGNMDLPPVNEWLERSGHNLHGQVRGLAPDIALLGIGGSTFTPMHTPSEFSEDAYRQWLKKLWPIADSYQHKVLVSHNPPRDTVCDDIGGGTHVGSVAVREFIEEHKPEICVCGHIHEGRGTDRIGDTLVINPGQLPEGGYVTIRMQDGVLSAELMQVPA